MTSLTSEVAPTHLPTTLEQVSAPGPVVLELVGLTAGYGDLEAVRDISLEVRAGEVVALFGANGAGKTTTLLATVGVIQRLRGSVHWLGAPTQAPLHKLARSGLFFVPEQRSVISGLTCRDNLRLARGDVDAALAHFPELAPLLTRPAGLLSGGEQQMLILGRALARRPKALLVDELSLGLAPMIVDRLLLALRKAADEEQLAVLLVEQQARRALATADRWYLLKNGSLSATGSGSDDSAVLEAAYMAGPLTTTAAQGSAPRRGVRSR